MSISFRENYNRYAKAIMPYLYCKEISRNRSAKAPFNPMFVVIVTLKSKLFKIEWLNSLDPRHARWKLVPFEVVTSPATFCRKSSVHYRISNFIFFSVVINGNVKCYIIRSVILVWCLIAFDMYNNTWWMDLQIRSWISLLHVVIRTSIQTDCIYPPN